MKLKKILIYGNFRKLNFCFLIQLFAIIVSSYGQEQKIPSLILGDSAPALRVSEWLKGKPIEKFEKGKIYVIEFWATWCSPCRAAMPRLSKLSRKYKHKAAFIGVDVYENQIPVAYRKNINQIKDFVDSMGRRMNYAVAIEDSIFMETDWLIASDEQGIPVTFVVNGDGRVAWFGHPMYLHETLPKILNKSWDINEELAKRSSDKHLEELGDSLSHQLTPYSEDPKIYRDFGQPDSVLLVINEWIKKEPKLKYNFNVVNNTFSSLLKTDQHKAYEYGKEILTTPTYDYSTVHQIIYLIESWSYKITLHSEIYELGAEAYQVEIDHFPYPEIANTPRLYDKMAEWYWHANNKSKAINANRKAIKAMKKYSR